MSIPGCHNCRIGPGDACETCRRASQDDIRIQHSPHNRSEYQAATPPTPSVRATGLPEDVEDTLRKFLCDMFDLEPIQLMLLAHVMHGGTTNTFGDEFRAFLRGTIRHGDRSRREDWERACDEYGAIISRQAAMAMWTAMKRRLPLLAIFQQWSEGHGGRQAEPKEEPRTYQGFLDFGGDRNG